MEEEKGLLEHWSEQGSENLARHLEMLADFNKQFPIQAVEIDKAVDKVKDKESVLKILKEFVSRLEARIESSTSKE
jgi:hypothetical protein